ncbi:MAG TPA: hypothetical protein DDY13_07905 [Cytophagales bacterium]|jgi:hypothetical protein|nr:hypothetical protein [Cytophagales bacterium]
MEKIKFPILFTTYFIIILNLLPFLGVAYAIIAGMLFVAPFIVIWMVWRVLKDGIPSEHTFDEVWYEDVK